MQAAGTPVLSREGFAIFLPLRSGCPGTASAMTDVSSLLCLCLLESCHNRDSCACGTVNAGIPGEPCRVGLPTGACPRDAALPSHTCLGGGSSTLTPRQREAFCLICLMTTNPRAKRSLFC